MHSLPMNLPSNFFKLLHIYILQLHHSLDTHVATGIQIVVGLFFLGKFDEGTHAGRNILAAFVAFNISI